MIAAVWDLAMDWSRCLILYHRQTRLTVLGLCNPYAEYPFLRDVLGYKRPWVYYLAMILDPILRFNWVFYAVYSRELQHSAILSFFVGLSEVCRRGMWTLFRVENEHCTNVGSFRASRDVPLPYDIEPPSPPSQEDDTGDRRPTEDPSGLVPDQGATTSNLEAQPVGTSLRRRAAVPHNTPIQRGMARVSTMIGEAHTQDFERKRRPAASVPAMPYQNGRSAPESSDDEDDGGDSDDVELPAMGGEDVDDVRDVQGAEEIMRRRRSAMDT